MKECFIGKSGLRVSAVALGCNNFGWSIDEAASQKVVTRALDLGVTFFDTSDFYGNPSGSSETILGRTLGPRRKDAVVTTKFGIDLPSGGKRMDNSRRYVMQAAEASLKRLNTDWIDIYMIHFPDLVTPIEETLRALEDLVRSGKVRYIACSNMPSWRIVEAMWTSREINTNAFIVSQNEYSLLCRDDVERDIIPALSAYGLGLMPYFPLAGGLLTGKYSKSASTKAEGRLASNFIGLGNRFLTERNVTIAEKLNQFCLDRGHKLLDLAISWLVAQPTVSGVIAGATRPEQVEQNVQAAEWALSPEDLAEVDRLTKG